MSGQRYNPKPEGSVPLAPKQAQVTDSLTLDPLITRAQELLDKHRPTAEATLWLNPPAQMPPPASAGWRFWQPYFPAYHNLLAQRWVALPEPASPQTWDQIVLYASKQKEENWQLLQAAETLLSAAGEILFLVPNDYGSKSFQQGLQSSGRLLGYESGRKSRLYRLQRQGESSTPLFAPRKNRDGYWSTPGLFSWDRIDGGSRLLAQAILADPTPPAGPLADLGAGWGYLATQLSPRLRIHLLESDRRALQCAQLNLPDGEPVLHWCDLSQGQLPAPLKPQSMATVVTNPPFHAGKQEAAMLGQHFALAAHRLLRPGGVLWLVGNTHLAYPRLLGSLFSHLEVKTQREGFTVLRAVK